MISTHKVYTQTYQIPFLCEEARVQPQPADFLVVSKPFFFVVQHHLEVCLHSHVTLDVVRAALLPLLHFELAQWVFFHVVEDVLVLGSRLRV
jgi:hypothetical protein